jgi:predicted CoA-binding protein
MDTKEILKKFRTIAVVGCSSNPSKAANQIPQYLQQAGYRVIPINPGVDEILGEKAYRSLADLPAELKIRIEIINIFRPSETVEPIVDQAIEIKKEFARPYVTKGSMKYFTLLLSGHALREERKHENQYVSCM